MANLISIDLKGIEQLDRRLAAMPARIENKVLRHGLRKAGNYTRKVVRAHTPVDTGKLKRSVQLRVTTGGGEATAKVHFGKRAYIARFQQHGTKKMRARPFMPDVSEYEGEVRQILSDELKAAVEGL